MLNITEAVLPNQTLPKHWYTGRKSVTHLYINWVALAIIEADAFIAVAFHALYDLRIHNTIHIIQYQAYMFDGLKQLVLLVLSELDTIYSPLPENFLQPMRGTMMEFEYYGDIGDEPVMSYLFGATRMPSLTSITIDCEYWSTFRLIAAANFTGLTALRYLSMVRCGIDAIDANAFDGIAETLEALHLVGNRQLQLSPEQFRHFLDTRSRSRSPKYLVLYRSTPFNCSIDFYRLRNATMISFHYDLIRSRFMQCAYDIHHFDENKYGPQQIIHLMRRHLNQPEIYKYTFRRFRMHLNATDRTLIICQGDSDKYRAFIWSINSTTAITGRSKCPLKSWIQSNINCQQRHRVIENIVLPQPGNTSDLLAVCIIHISAYKQSLPLHCRVIHSSEMLRDDFTFNWLYCGAVIVTAYIFLVPIAIIAFCSKRGASECRNRNETIQEL